jgi:hypothetical protein
MGLTPGGGITRTPIDTGSHHIYTFPFAPLYLAARPELADPHPRREAVSQFVIPRRTRRGIQNDLVLNDPPGFRVSPKIVGLARNDSFVQFRHGLRRGKGVVKQAHRGDLLGIFESTFRVMRLAMMNQSSEITCNASVRPKPAL